MAKALVMAVNKTHPDPVKDARGCHKRGDIIVVKPDAHVWSTAEQNPASFALVDVPDAWLSDANDYTGLLFESASEIIPFSARQKRGTDDTHSHQHEALHQRSARRGRSLNVALASQPFIKSILARLHAVHPVKVVL